MNLIKRRRRTMIDNTVRRNAEQSEPDFDESLGVEQLPQAELEASPGDGGQQTSDLDINEAGIATTDTPMPNHQQQG
jgi:hypothetical protein